MPTKCTSCDKEFQNEEGLEQHVAAKHPTEAKKQFVSVKTKKSIRNWSTILVLAFLIVGAIWYFGTRETEEEIIIEGENPIPNYAIHWHPQLTIIINGEKQPIPANIGLGGSIHAPVHTHETNGTLHLENNYPSRNNMRLGYFFEVWNKEFSNECIFDYCTDKGILKMTVNGEENTAFDNYVMADGDVIVVEYTSFETQ